MRILGSLAAIVMMIVAATLFFDGRASHAAHDAASLAAAAQETPKDGVRRITPADLHAALDKGTAVVVDVRGEDTYKAGHVKGAFSIPLLEISNRAKQLPRDKMIVTYCS